MTKLTEQFPPLFFSCCLSPLSFNTKGRRQLTWLQSTNRMSGHFTAGKDRRTINLHHPHLPHSLSPVIPLSSCRPSTSPSLPGIGWGWGAGERDGGEGQRVGLRVGLVVLNDVSPCWCYGHVQQCWLLCSGSGLMQECSYVVAADYCLRCVVCVKEWLWGNGQNVLQALDCARAGCCHRFCS